MKNAVFKRLLVLLLAALTTFGCTAGAFAADASDSAVRAVIEQLEAIDTVQEIQNKRSEYPVTYNHYDSGTTDSAVINQHETARAGYEAQIDPSLVAKLNDELPNEIHIGTYPVTPQDNEYQFEIVDGGTGYGYEVSNHMVSKNIPQIFILVDTADGKTSWTPSGLYQYGVSKELSGLYRPL